jgi:hypothetical protein
MFQEPLYQWCAGTVGVSDGVEATTLPDEISGQDASAVGSPTYHDDHGGLVGVETGGTSDGYTYNPAAEHPVGNEPWSIAATVWIDSDGYFVWWGERNDGQLVDFYTTDGGTLELANYGYGQAAAPVSYGQWVTIGGRYDGSGTVKVYVNGGDQTGTNSTETLNVQNTNHSLAFDAASNGYYWGGKIHEIIISTASESDQAFSDYHNDRLG